MFAAPPKADGSGDEPTVGHHDDLRALSICGCGHLCAAGVALVPHLQRSNDHRVLPKSDQPLESKAVGRGEGETHGECATAVTVTFAPPWSSA